MQGRFKMEYRLFTIVRYNYRDYNKYLVSDASRKGIVWNPTSQSIIMAFGPIDNCLDLDVESGGWWAGLVLFRPQAPII